MIEPFPPETTREDEIKMLLEFMATVIDGRTAIYVSGPLTTGKRFSDWYARFGTVFDLADPSHGAEHRRRVVEPNREDVQKLANDLRSKLGRVVIDPTALLDFSGWTQSDYHVLWGRVIERYVETVVLADGWQYSNGCSYEFFVAHTSGARTVDWHQRPLTLHQGTRLIQAAIEEMRVRAIPTDFLEQVVKKTPMR